MTNNELMLKFQEIAMLNVFDAHCALKDMKKEYKKSEFYKRTHYSLNKAYKLFISGLFAHLYFKLQELTDVDMIGIKITQILENIDMNSIENLFNNIVEKFNLNNLEQEKGELKQAIANLKSII